MIDLNAVAPEDLQKVASLMATMAPEKRGEVPLRVQRAARDFLAKSEPEQRVAADRETDPVRKVVFAALAKQLPAPAPTLDPLRREALGTLVKAVTAGAKAGLEKSMLARMGAKAGIGAARLMGRRGMDAARMGTTGAKIGSTAAQVGRKAFKTAMVPVAMGTAAGGALAVKAASRLGAGKRLRMAAGSVGGAAGGIAGGTVGLMGVAAMNPGPAYMAREQRKRRDAARKQAPDGDLEKSLLGNIGAKFGVGRSGGMRAMMAGARAGKAEGKELVAKHPNNAWLGDGVKYIKQRTRMRADEARLAYNSGAGRGADKLRNAGTLVGQAAVLGGGTYASYRGAKALNDRYELQSPVKRRANKQAPTGALKKGEGYDQHMEGQKKREKKWAKTGAKIGAGIGALQGAAYLASGGAKYARSVGVSPGKIAGMMALNVGGKALTGTGLGWGAARVSREPYKGA